MSRKAILFLPLRRCVVMAYVIANLLLLVVSAFLLTVFAEMQCNN
jgi:hypothetical protein